MSHPLQAFRSRSGRKTLLVLAALDTVSTLAVFNLVGHFRGVSEGLIIWPLLAPLAALSFAIYLIGGYRSRTDMMSLDYTNLHAVALVAAMLATLLLTFVFFPGGFELQSSRTVIALSFLVIIPLTLSYRRLVYEKAIAARSGYNFVFLGPKESCEAFREECRAMSTWQPVIHSWPSATPPAAETAGDEILSQPFPEVLAAVAEDRLAVEAIVLSESSRGLGAETAQQLVQLHFNGIPTYTSEQFHQFYWQKIPLRCIEPSWLFQEGFQITREPVFERMKRASDMVLSTLGLLLAAPFIALAAIAILVEDRGPVFFHQNRVGMHRRIFSAAKLRSMRSAAPKDGNLYTQPGDTRVTRVGRILRVTHLDELPQLWNVLKGDMSLIGPRPEWDRLVDEYESKIPCYDFRHLVKPGITGWAQVNYHYGASIDDTIRKLEYDLYYIRNFSFTLDASIMIKTVHVMLFGKGR
jgi:exopolysaccharide biosynthesis polyprenyl glycosylphosphotransferase